MVDRVQSQVQHGKAIYKLLDKRLISNIYIIYYIYESQ